MTRIRTSLCGLLLAATTATCFASDPAPKKAPAPLEDAARRMTVPGGFQVKLFAGEPDVRQPIAFTFDDRGRLWVAECYSYPVWLTPGEPKRDRVLIFEDTDGDGRFDKRKVFFDQAQNLTGIELGFGGVWLCSTPNLLFVPDRDGDDVPDGKPEVVLDGWSTKAQHNMFNGLIWAPDGWLWGCNGITATSYVGKPGTPDKDRTAINCGVWRYHPTRKIFETVANGTTNPWGLDFDEYGEAFISNCVIPHAYHVLHGAHFERMFGQDFNPYLYQLMPTIADHIHWAGGPWGESRGGKGKHGEAGGGHAHVGAMVYLGDNWPDSYRNSLYTFNLHGNRINHDTLEWEHTNSHPDRRSSTYVAKHRPDFLMGNDEWFRGIALKYGPDGSVFMIDWSDTDECHDTDANGPERETGRIYRVAYGTPKPWSGDLAKLSDRELVELLFHKNEWFGRHARRILQERASSGKDMAAIKKTLLPELQLLLHLDENYLPLTRLRALWALHAIDGLELGHLTHLATLGSSKDTSTTSWAIRLLAYEPQYDKKDLLRVVEVAGPRNPKVRTELASAAASVPGAEREKFARVLVWHSSATDDLPLSLMTWYGIQPTVAMGGANAVDLAYMGKNPLIRKYVARCLTQVAEESADRREGFLALVAKLGDTTNSPLTLDLISGIREALRGRKTSAKPPGWDAAYVRLAGSTDPEVREQAMLLALIYSDAKAVDDLRKLAFDSKAEAARRIRAMEALVDHRQPGFASDLRRLLDESDLRGSAIRALAAFEDADSTKLLLDRYKTFSDSEKADAVATLAARKGSAAALLDAIASGMVPRRDVSVAIARQVLAFKDAKLAEKLEAAWGSINPTSREKTVAMARYKAILSPEGMKVADASRGRAIFAKSCASCHKLFDAGGDVGPELTGSNRANLDYLLENVLDPSASVGNDYRLTNVATKDGRLIAGIVRGQDGKTLTIRTANESVTLPRDEIEEVRASNVSMMPEGLFEALSEQEVRDLAAYLGAKVQVPAPIKPL